MNIYLSNNQHTEKEMQNYSGKQTSRTKLLLNLLLHLRYLSADKTDESPDKLSKLNFRIKKAFFYYILTKNLNFNFKELYII